MKFITSEKGQPHWVTQTVFTNTLSPSVQDNIKNGKVKISSKNFGENILCTKHSISGLLFISQNINIWKWFAMSLVLVQTRFLFLWNNNISLKTKYHLYRRELVGEIYLNKANKMSQITFYRLPHKSIETRRKEQNTSSVGWHDSV